MNVGLWWATHRVVTPVDIITHEQIVCVRSPATYPKQLHEVVELPMHVSAHRYRTAYWLHIGLLQKHIPGLRQKTSVERSNQEPLRPSAVIRVSSKHSTGTKFPAAPCCAPGHESVHHVCSPEADVTVCAAKQFVAKHRIRQQASCVLW